MIYVECDPDFVLVKSITNISAKRVAHAGGGKSRKRGGGKSRVCQQLKERENCKGVVDQDPQSSQPDYMKGLKENDLFQCSLKVLYDEHRNNRLFVLCPKLENWILKAAEEAGLDVGKYGLPNNPRKLHREINVSLNKFERLVKDLKASNRLRTLKRLLEG